MSYRIDYEPHKNKHYPPAVKKNALTTIIAWIAACLVIVLLVYSTNMPAIMSSWSEMLDDFAFDLRYNTAIGRTVAGYAQDVFENAKFN